MKKLALLASTAIALACAASLVATPADAKRHHKRPAAAAASQTAAAPGPGPYGPGPYMGAEPRHDPGGPMKSGNMCWKDAYPWANRGIGRWDKC